MKSLSILFSICFFPVWGQYAQTPFTQPPEWSQQAIWYQIMVERFYNGDSSNDPTAEDIAVPPMGIYAPQGWMVMPWNSDWSSQQGWEKSTGMPVNETMQYRRYGGDLQGIINKLDYLQELGITALFINPVNNAPSLHKYDASHYHHIDIHFGPDPKGDKLIISSEIASDPSTWKWTSSDKLFLKLVEEVHKRNMRIIIDYSWNHTGTLFWAWQDILRNQASSPFRDWYSIQSFDDPGTKENEFKYRGWSGNKYMPELKKTHVLTDRKSGHPYEGDINEGAKKHIFQVVKRWLSPDGDRDNGVDGFRLDVADEIGLEFWRDFRRQVRVIQPDAYLVGEIWWEKWPDKLMNPVPYTLGDVFDAVMFYQAYQPARYFFAKTNFETNAKIFRDSLQYQWNRLKTPQRYAMMNVSSTHDTPRLLTCFYNPNMYKYHSTPSDDPDYKTGKPDGDTYHRLKLYLVHLFTSVGAPQIWNGEEMGMWGADDPFCRKPLWWPEIKFEPELRNNFQSKPVQYDSAGFNEEQYAWYKKLIAIRKENPVLTSGDIQFLIADGKKLAYKRYDGRSSILVLFNLEAGNQTFVITEPGKYINLLTGKVDQMSSLTLNKFSAAVLRKVN